MLEEDVIAHYGVKGMKWGVRQAEVNGVRGRAVTTEVKEGKRSKPVNQQVNARQRPGGFVRTSGGKRIIADEDAVQVAVSRQMAKRSTTDALSTKQLQDAVQRMNLEQQYHKLVKQTDRRNRGQKIVAKIVRNKKYQDVAKAGGEEVFKMAAARAAAKGAAKTAGKLAIAAA